MGLQSHVAFSSSGGDGAGRLGGAIGLIARSYFLVKPGDHCIHSIQNGQPFFQGPEGRFRKNARSQNNRESVTLMSGGMQQSTFQSLYELDH